jgi:hypothetical protein
MAWGQHLAIHLCYPTRSFHRLLIGSIDAEGIE